MITEGAFEDSTGRSTCCVQVACITCLSLGDNYAVSPCKTYVGPMCSVHVHVEYIWLAFNQSPMPGAQAALVTQAVSTITPDLCVMHHELWVKTKKEAHSTAKLSWE